MTNTTQTSSGHDLVDEIARQLHKHTKQILKEKEKGTKKSSRRRKKKERSKKKMENIPKNIRRLGIIRDKGYYLR